MSKDNSVIGNNVEIGDRFSMGHFCIIEDNVTIGNHVTIMHYVWLKEGTVLKDGVFIDSYCKTGENLVVREGTTFKPLSQISDDVQMGKNVFIGPDVVILRGQVNKGQAPPIIGNNVYIGGCVTILPGLTIGDNAILGAGAVITKDVPEGAVMVGNPAKRISRYGDKK